MTSPFKGGPKCLSKYGLAYPSRRLIGSKKLPVTTADLHNWSIANLIHYQETFFCVESNIFGGEIQRKDSFDATKMSLQEKLEKIRSPKLQSQQQVILPFVPTSPEDSHLTEAPRLKLYSL
jgi:hypothetical protein